MSIDRTIVDQVRSSGNQALGVLTTSGVYFDDFAQFLCRY